MAILLSRSVHAIETAVVVVDVSIAATPVDVVLHAGETAVEARVGGLPRRCIAHVLVHCVHLSLWGSLPLLPPRYLFSVQK